MSSVQPTVVRIKLKKPRVEAPAKQVVQAPKKSSIGDKQHAAVLRARLYMGESAETLAHEEGVSVEVIQKLLEKKGDKPLDIIFRAGHDFDERVLLAVNVLLRGFNFDSGHIATSLGVINGIFYIWMKGEIEHRLTWSEWRRYDGSACNLDKGIYKMYGRNYDTCRVITFNTPEKLQVLLNYRKQWDEHLENKKKNTK